MEKRISSELIIEILKPRKLDSNKGDYGHALIIAGERGKMGAAVLASKACLRSGVGLLSVHIPSCGVDILQTSIPEAMLSIDSNMTMFSDELEIDKYSAVSFGPGLGTNILTQKAISYLLMNTNRSLVIDADGLNCISLNKELISSLPINSILTPHPKEFERLVGPWENDIQKQSMQLEFSKKHNIILILKGHNTRIASPQGEMFINSTGNPGMAKGGTGDVLTGMITAFLAQGYTPLNASILGVYLHGSAGDIAAEEMSENAMLATDLINCIPKAFLKLKQ